MKSDPEMEKKGTPASPATAFAMSVLPVPGGPTSRTPVGSAPPEPRKLLGAFQKLDDLRDLFFRFLQAGDIVKRHALRGIVFEQRGCAVAEISAAPPSRHCPHEEEPDPDDQPQGKSPEQQGFHPFLLLDRREGDGSSVRLRDRLIVPTKERGQLVGVGLGGDEGPPLGPGRFDRAGPDRVRPEGALDARTVDDLDTLDVAGVDVIEERAVLDREGGVDGLPPEPEVDQKGDDNSAPDPECKLRPDHRP